MDIDDLMEMKLKDVLDEFCIVFSPECDYYYGVAKWEDAEQMYEEYDLEDEYCFSGDSLIPMIYCVEYGEPVLELSDLRRILDCLGIKKKGESDE